MSWKKYKKAFFIGIGGIGMSGIARWLLNEGWQIAGYDRVSSPLTKILEREGAQIQYDDDWEKIPADFKDSKECLIVKTPAVPDSMGVYQSYKNHGFEIVKRSELLGAISKDYFTIAVAGTHGKTSTTAIIAHLLEYNQIGQLAFVGGIMSNYNSNYLASKENDKKILVVEADEYDRSFLQLHPDILVVTATEPDHLDVYGSADRMLATYQQLVDKVNVGGQVIIHESVPLKIPSGIEEIRYGGRETGNYAQFISPFECELITQNLKPIHIVMAFAGRHNQENAIAATLSVSDFIKTTDQYQNAFSSFKGIRRRFEKIYQDEKRVLIDDYAHHPTELEKAISTAKECYPDKALHVFFQPHLYSRTRDFYTGFARVLDKADGIYLLPIYPARELLIEGVTSELIFNEMKLRNKNMIQASDIEGVIKKITEGVILTLGAGDIDKEVEKIKAIIS